jgi:hypothetical protein
MGLFVIVAYRPKPDKHAELKQAIRDHLVVLRQEGLATDHPPLVLQAKDGTMLEIFEWKSPDAIQEAHANPAVLALWKRFQDSCDYVNLSALEESSQLFPSFIPVTL